jgi:hypothetical protein
VLFAWVDLHDLRVVLEVSLSEVATEAQFHRETHTAIDLRKECQNLMRERKYRAQMEVSLFGMAIVNLCEEMNARYHAGKPYCTKDYVQLFKFVLSFQPRYEVAHNPRSGVYGSMPSA